MMNSRGKSFQTKQEGGDADESSTRTNTTTTASTSTSRQWAGFRNPRIVRVSRSFGGKDRHSKVCTVRGLRDRRIRLSVPTAIQLYDLQDRLGLSQPSKVVDWLIDNTKSDIDKLPPLQFPPENFLNMGSSSSSTSQFPNFFNNIGSTSNADPAGSSVGLDQLTAQNFFPVGNQSSFPTLLNNPIFPYNNPFYHWDSQLGQPNGIIPMHTQDSNINTTSSTTTTSMLLPASASHQLYFCPPSLPSYMAQAPVLENDPTRQGGVSHFQFLNSASSAPVLQPNSSLMPTLHFIRPEILRMQENNSNHPNKGGNTGTSNFPL